MKRNSILSIIAACLLMSLVSLAASDTPKGSAGAGAAHPELVVSTQWLADHLNDPNLVIVHIAHDEGDYRAAHIPGARYLAMDKFATDQMTKPGTELLPPDPLATRLFFTMDYVGHGNQAALLDGGLDQWTREKRPVSTQVTTGKPGSLTVHLHPEIIAKMDYMKKLVDHPEQGV